MGRITIFSTNDVHTKRILIALEQREIPYVKISLDQCPRKREDCYALSSSASSPQVFFNTRYIGGAEATVNELVRWDKKADGSTPLERYKRDIQSHPEPGNHRFSVPHDSYNDPAVCGRHCRKYELVKSIMLPTGKKVAIVEILETLRCASIVGETKRGSTVYLRSFTGKTLVTCIKLTYGVDRHQAFQFAEKLHMAEIISSIVHDEEPFQDDDEEIYRLQCDTSPDVLNSFRVWPECTKRKCEEVIGDLDELLREIECDSVSSLGKIDYLRVRAHTKYVMLEDAACELQQVRFCELTENEILAFGLNVFHFMVRFAFSKVGLCTSESCRRAFLRNLKFNIGGQIYTFQQWTDGVLRCNRATRFTNTIPFSEGDPRAKYTLAKFDPRIHFALNVGPWFGSAVHLPFHQFTSADIHQELEIAARVFCEDDHLLKIDHKKAKIRISQGLLWYRQDLATTDKGLITVISQYLEGEKMLRLKKARHQRRAVKVRLLDIDCTRFAENYVVFDEATLKAQVVGVKNFFRRFLLPRRPNNELVRLSALHNLNILDTPAEERFDRLTRMVQVAFHAPVVYVSLVDERRTWSKSIQWDAPFPRVQEAEREYSFCAHAILGKEDEVFEVPDLSQDIRFADHPFVRDTFQVRYYMAVNLSVPSGKSRVNVGTLCMFDFKPRKMDPQQRAVFCDFARLVKEELMRRRSSQVELGRFLLASIVATFSKQF